MGLMGERYDLEERLLDYAAQVIRLVERLPATRAGNHVAGQLLRSGTSALPNHGEAQAAESRKDFIHKLKICHKELKETARWLQWIGRVPLLGREEVDPLSKETDELVRIFASSIRTAERNRGRTG
jgi:four helix bundle protein